MYKAESCPVAWRDHSAVIKIYKLTCNKRETITLGKAAEIWFQFQEIYFYVKYLHRYYSTLFSHADLDQVLNVHAKIPMHALFHEELHRLHGIRNQEEFSALHRACSLMFYTNS